MSSLTGLFLNPICLSTNILSLRDNPAGMEDGTKPGICRCFVLRSLYRFRVMQTIRTYLRQESLTYYSKDGPF